MLGIVMACVVLRFRESLLPDLMRAGRLGVEVWKVEDGKKVLRRLSGAGTSNTCEVDGRGD